MTGIEESNPRAAGLEDGVKRLHVSARRFALNVLMGAVFGLGAAAYAAYADDPDPADDAPEAASDAQSATGEEDKGTQDAGVAGDSVDATADTETAADAADDAIPTDTVLDPTRTAWDVVEFEDDGDNQEDVAQPGKDGIGNPEDMPTVRPHKAAAKKPGTGADEGDFLQSAGGRPVPDRGAPWQAEIYGPFPVERFKPESRAGKALWQLQHYCGGSLIEDDWVLTAAHCIDQDMVNVGYRVRLGAEDISKDMGMTFKIDRIVRHANYDTERRLTPPNMYANDIALVHIVQDGKQRQRDPSQVRKIPLDEGPPVAAGLEVTGTGWGKTLPVEGNSPNAVLLKVDLKVLGQEECANLPGYNATKIHSKVFCARNPQRSTCQGDSGGPIIFTNGVATLVGIISWGKKRCSGNGQPGVYTRVSSYIDWIERAKKLDPKKNSLP